MGYVGAPVRVPGDSAGRAGDSDRASMGGRRSGGRGGEGVSDLSDYIRWTESGRRIRASEKANRMAELESKLETYREALSRIKSHTQLWKEDSNTVLRQRMQVVHEEA